MSALTFVLFFGAALLAVAAIALSAQHYAAAWFAMARQLERGNVAPRKHLVYARRLKQAPTRRALARARRALGHHAKIAAKSGVAPRMFAHDRYFGFGIALGRDKLMVE